MADTPPVSRDAASAGERSMIAFNRTASPERIASKTSAASSCPRVAMLAPFARVLAVPLPSVAYDLFQRGALRVPAEEIVRPLGRCDEDGRVACAACAVLHRDIAAGD